MYIHTIESRDDYKRIYVDGIKTRYFINRTGNVLGYKYKQLRTHICRQGYERITLRVNKKTRNQKIHRLVAIAHIPNPTNEEQVNHMNGNKLDNNYTNLEWCNGSYNILHSQGKYKTFQEYLALH